MKERSAMLTSFYFLDGRSLSLCRIAMGLILLTDTLYRIYYASDLLSENGIWPLRYVTTFGWQPGFWSLYLLTDHPFFTLVLLFLQGLLSIAFILGVGRKYTQLSLWILLVSVQNRNLFILQSGDDLIRLFLFFSLFTNLFTHFTFPFKNAPGRHNYVPIYSGNLILIIQISCVYFFTAFLKFQGTDWLPDGTAVYYALSIDQIRWGLAEIIYPYPLFMKFLTYLIYIIEFLLPLIILSPFRTQKCRNIAFYLILFIHLGFALTLKIGFFPWISIACGCIFFPSWIWDKASEKFFLLRNNFIEFHQPYFSAFSYAGWLSLSICIVIIFINLQSLKSFPWESSSPMNVFINVFRLNQYWGMFSPNIPRSDGWYEAWGHRPDGGIVLLEAPDPLNSGTKLPKLHAFFPTDRWRKLTENLSRDEYTFLRPLFCRYLLHKHQAIIKEKNISGLELVFFRENNRANYTTHGPFKELWCYCTK